jgi:5-methyltetrahydropteroyltriglutamate--homocysteine methyltransferase
MAQRGALRTARGSYKPGRRWLRIVGMVDMAAEATSRIPFRADHVGSFLRPPELLAARARRQRGEITPQALRAVEDQAIRGVVEMQERAGLLGITDGEFRRTFFHIDFLERLAGVVTGGAVTVKFHNRSGDIDFAPPVMQVVGKVRHTEPIQSADFGFLQSVTHRTPKVSIPSPTMLHFRGGRSAISQDAYPELDAFFDDVAAAYRAEIRALAAAGCRYLQLDDTNLAYLCDAKMREGVRARGDDPNELPRRYARLINAAIADKPPGMTICIHLCRGNFQSAWVAEGGYEPVAEVLFNELRVDGYFLEYDDARSGGFAPLRFVPSDKRIVLGLVSSKLADLESKDDLRRRIDEAAEHVPLEQLCLSPSADSRAPCTATRSRPRCRPPSCASSSRRRSPSGARCDRDSGSPFGAPTRALARRARARGGGSQPAAHGGGGQLVERAHLEVLAGLAVAFEPPVRIGVGAGRSRQDQVHVCLEARHRAHDVAAHREERHAPLDGRRRVGGRVADHRAQLVEDGAQVRGLLGEESVDGRAQVGPPTKLLRGGLGSPRGPRGLRFRGGGLGLGGGGSRGPGLLCGFGRLFHADRMPHRYARQP